MNNANTAATAAAVREYDKKKASEACDVLTVIESLLAGYSLNSGYMDWTAIVSLSSLMKWIREAIDQDGLIND